MVMAARRRVSSLSDLPSVGEGQSESTQSPHESQEQPSNMEQIENRSGTSKKAVRGRTTGQSVQKKRRRMEKLYIVIHPKRRRIVGENAKDFKTEACVVLKQHASLQIPHWKDIPIESKRKMWLAMKQKFNLQDSERVQEVVFDQLNRQYRSHRHKLHVYYLENRDNEDVLEKPPEEIKKEDWEVLIDYFESDEFKKISERNKKNREKLKIAHTCGTKSIAQYCYEERDLETGEEPTRTTTWRITRYNNKKKNWVDDKSDEAYERIIKLQSGESEEAEGPLSEDEAFIKVLGEEKPNRLRGCGDGLKPPSNRGHKINVELAKENEELRKQAEEDKEALESLKKQNEEMALRAENLESQVTNQESQIQAKVQDVLRDQLPTILQSLSQAAQTPPTNV